MRTSLEAEFFGVVDRRRGGLVRPFPIMVLISADQRGGAAVGWTCPVPAFFSQVASHGRSHFRHLGQGGSSTLRRRPGQTAGTGAGQNARDGTKAIQGGQGLRLRGRLVDRLQICCNLTLFLWIYESKAVPDHVHDTGLNRRVGEYCIDRLRISDALARDPKLRRLTPAPSAASIRQACLPGPGQHPSPHYHTPRSSKPPHHPARSRPHQKGSHRSFVVENP